MNTEYSEDSDGSRSSPVLLTQPIRPVLLGHTHRIGDSASADSASVDSASVDSSSVYSASVISASIFSTSLDSMSSDSVSASRSVVSTSEEEDSLTDARTYDGSTTDLSEITVASLPSVIHTNDEDSVSPPMSHSPSILDNESDTIVVDGQAMNVTGVDDNADSRDTSVSVQIRERNHSEDSVAGDFSGRNSIAGLTDESSRPETVADTALHEHFDIVPSPEPNFPAASVSTVNNLPQQPDLQLNETANNYSPTTEGTNSLMHGPSSSNPILMTDPHPPSTSGIQEDIIPIIQLNEVEPTVTPPLIDIDHHEDGLPSGDLLLHVPSTSREAKQESRSPSNDKPPCKRPRLSPEDSPVKKVKANAVGYDDDDADGTTCTICLDQWTSSGEHRIVSLKCGHLFGYSCIEKWIKNSRPAEKKCPTCKTKAKISDIRNIYGHKIQMLDTTELEQLRVKNQTLEEEKELLTNQVTYARKRIDDLMESERQANMIIQEFKSERNAPQKSSTTSRFQYRIHLIHTLELSKTEGCRVSAFNDQKKILVASIPSPTNLFQEFSLKMIDAESFKPLQTIPAHDKMIRDVAFSNDGKFLVSCGLDKVASVRCMDSSTAVVQFKADLPLWSVCWDADNPWVLFTGAVTGLIQQFDLRNTGRELSRITTAGDMSPAMSLASIPQRSSLGWMQGGLLACRLFQVYPYRRERYDMFEREPCYIEGVFSSMSYDRNTDQLLVSTRPTQRTPRAQHFIFKLTPDLEKRDFRPVRTFLGSTSQAVISRSCLFPAMGDMIVASYFESESKIGLWSVSNGHTSQPTPDIVMDFCPVYVNGNTYLTALSGKSLRVYKLDKE